ncbi:tyrosine-type recombinase/integrase [Brevibacterium casei]|uniref:tyrosine-type recombinase/integrase n=1 Tax=Brevibacterium casei TaxID=33889 RepID=UPI00241EB993|nr:site-specific integrase [Brevibacterium casei]
MASIKRRNNGKWRARYRDADGREHARHFDRKFDAQQWLDDETVKLRTGTWVEPAAGKMTLEEWFDEWSSIQVWEHGTYLAAEQAVRSTPFLNRQLDKITVNDVQAWVKSMTKPNGRRNKGLEPSTIKTRYNYLHMCFSAAKKARKIGVVPSEDVTLPRLKRGGSSMLIPEPEQVRQVLESSEPYFATFISLCAFAGLRLGEAAGMQLDDVDFLKRTISVNRQVQGATNSEIRVGEPKYGSRRTIHVSERLIEVLSRHIADYGIREDENGQWLLSNGGHLFQRGSAGHYWREARAKVGMDDFTLHSLRHFFASGLIAAGCDVVTVQHALGHSTPAITLNTYGHLWPNADDKTRSAGTALMDSVFPSADSVRTGAGSAP